MMTNLSGILLLFSAATSTLGALGYRPVSTSPPRFWRQVRVAEKPVRRQNLRKTNHSYFVFGFFCTFDNFFLVEASFVFLLHEFAKRPGSFTEKFSSLVFLFSLPRPSLASWLHVKCLLESKLCPKSSLSKKSANEEFRLCPSPTVEFFLLDWLSLSMLISSSERWDCERPAWPPPSKHLSIWEICKNINLVFLSWFSFSTKRSSFSGVKLGELTLHN